MFKLLTGRRLLLAVLNRIESLIVHLDRAVKDIENQIDDHSAEISRHNSEIADLSAHRERAVRVSEKFRGLIA